MRYPKGLKEFIYNETDYRENKTLKISRFVSFIQMYEGKPLERIFGFLSDTKNRTMKDMLVKEVARNYDHKQWLGDVYACTINGRKYPAYCYKKDGFGLHKGNGWSFSFCYSMTDPNEFLEEHDIKYSGWDRNKVELDFLTYLTNYLENPKCELLVKAGLGYWTKYIKYLDTSKKSLHQIFKIKQECVPLLQDENFRYNELMACRKYGYTNIEDIKTRLCINEICRRKYYEDFIKEILKRDETFKYLSDNKFFLRYGMYDYMDYLKELKELGAITDNRSLYPKNFKTAHKKAASKIKAKESAKLMAGFTKSYEKNKKYEYGQDKYLIIAVSLPNQLYKESEVLGHCVRTYDEDVAAGRTEIMFIRKSKNPNRPFYTLELKNKKVIQVRGKENQDPNEEVIEFIRDWSKKFRIKYNPELQQSFN